MRILVLALVGLALCAPGADQKQKKPPDVEVLEAKARRGDGKLQFDGRVRTAGEKPFHGLVVFFDLVSAENEVVSTAKTVLEEDLIAPGQERSYETETADSVRAVKYRIRAFDTVGRELRGGNTGPFAID